MLFFSPGSLNLVTPRKYESGQPVAGTLAWFQEKNLNIKSDVSNTLHVS